MPYGGGTAFDHPATPPHGYQTLTLPPGGPWIQASAAEYVRLRTECVVPVDPQLLTAETGFDLGQLAAVLGAATVPPRGTGNLDVVRSDFGEVLSYLALEEDWGTAFAYKSVRDRELIRLPGRGIDAIGVEDGDPLRLVLCETKVSDEDRRPPQVVDASNDGLRAQHLGHLGQLTADTRDKVWNAARHARDSTTQMLFFRAAAGLEEGAEAHVELVSVCFLVRPHDRHTAEDFGSFQASPADYAPSSIRFIVAVIDGRVDEVVDTWHAAATADDEAGPADDA